MKTQMMKVKMIFNSKGYIAHPYTTEMFQVIQIQKTCGMNRAKSEKRRRECLESYLNAHSMTLDQYLELEAKSKEPFYYNSDGFILIPSDNVLSALVNASLSCPSSLRIDNLRSALESSDFVFNKKKQDAKLWERFAVVTSSQGKLSNQRALRSNYYISDCEAIGEIRYDDKMVKPKAIKELLDYLGRNVGIGASRKMGWGRFVVEEA